MTPSSAPFWIRMILAALVALAFVASPLAENAHAAETPAICYVDHGTDAAAPADTDRSVGHEHAVHHCGSCHQYVWRTDELQPLGLPRIAVRYSLVPDNALLNAPPYELLRPPRA